MPIGSVFGDFLNQVEGKIWNYITVGAVAAKEHKALIQRLFDYIGYTDRGFYFGVGDKYPKKCNVCGFEYRECQRSTSFMTMPFADDAMVVHPRTYGRFELNDEFRGFGAEDLSNLLNALFPGTVVIRRNIQGYDPSDNYDHEVTEQRVCDTVYDASAGTITKKWEGKFNGKNRSGSSEEKYTPGVPRKAFIEELLKKSRNDGEAKLTTLLLSLLVSAPDGCGNAEMEKVVPAFLQKGIQKVEGKPVRITPNGKWSISVPAGFSYTMDNRCRYNTVDENMPLHKELYSLQIQRTADSCFENLFASDMSIALVGRYYIDETDKVIIQNTHVPLGDTALNLCAVANQLAMKEYLQQLSESGKGQVDVIKSTPGIMIIDMGRYPYAPGWVQYHAFWVIAAGSNTHDTLLVKCGYESGGNQAVLELVQSIEAVSKDNLDYRDSLGIESEINSLSFSEGKYASVKELKQIKWPIPDGFTAVTDLKTLSAQPGYMPGRMMTVIPADYPSCADPYDAWITLSLIAQIDLGHDYIKILAIQMLETLLQSSYGMYEEGMPIDVVQATDKAILAMNTDVGSEGYSVTFVYLWYKKKLTVGKVILNLGDKKLLKNTEVYEAVRALVYDWLSHVELPGSVETKEENAFAEAVGDIPDNADDWNAWNEGIDTYRASTKKVTRSDSAERNAYTEEVDHDQVIVDYGAPIEINGSHFVLSQFNDDDKVMWKDRITIAGGTVHESVTRNCNYLVMDNIYAQTVKYKAAREKRRNGQLIRVITTEMLEQAMNGTYMPNPKVIAQEKAEMEAWEKRKADESAAKAEAAEKEKEEKLRQKQLKAEKRQQRCEEKALNAEQEKREAHLMHLKELRRTAEEFIAAHRSEPDEQMADFELPESVLYAPGTEPEHRKVYLTEFFSRLDEAYPDRVLTTLKADHPKWYGRAQEWAKEFGYPDAVSFLTAYGYTPPAIKNGRPKTNDFGSTILELKKRYEGRPKCTKPGQLVADNPDLKLRTLQNKCPEETGLGFGDYLMVVGLVVPEGMPEPDDTSIPK